MTSERATLYVFSIGEAHDDLTPVFVIDGRDYPDDEAVRADVDAARRALHDRRLIGDVASSAVHVQAPRSPLPPWPRWRARHIDGDEPIGVRPRGDTALTPAGWDDMCRWLEHSKTWLDGQLAGAAATLSGARVRRTREPSVRRAGAGSVVPAEERYRMDVDYLVVPPAGTESEEVLERLAEWLRANGWTVAAPAESPGYIAVAGTQSGYTVDVVWARRDRAVTLAGHSPEVGAGTFATSGGDEG